MALLLVLAGPWGSAAFAQLDETCTVAVLNRTANVQRDGGFALPNVPSNLGQIRARATCVSNGVTRSGQSDFFEVPSRRPIATRVPKILFDAPRRPPESVRVTSSSAFIGVVGGVSQLSVVATYPDGSTADVTASAQGTSYTVTNPAIATVSASGLVTAVASGTVIVSASNDGVLSSVSVTVSLSGDADGDGLPDDFEVAAGLSPSNPIDALEDADGDGISNRAEFDLGTGLFDSDSDDDGIADGEEIVAGQDGFVTDPTRADSDGDMISDSLEIGVGTDPTQGASFDLTGLILSVELTPRASTLVFNTIDVESTQQYRLLAKLVDGSTADFTDARFGTTFASSDPSVAGFGGQAGLVFAGANGIATITASLQGFSAQATLGVASFSPTARGFFQFPTSTSANDVDVEGRWAFVAAGDGGLYVIDVSKPDAPTLAGSLDTTGIAKDVVVSGNRAVLADGPAGLKVIDVTNPAAPLLTGGIATTDAQGIAVFGPRVFVADGSSGVRVIDVTDPVAPVLVATVDTPGTAKGVAVAPASNLLAVADGASGLQLIDLSDMNAPQLVGSVNTNGNARNVALRGDVALLADFTGALLAIDVSDRTAPRLSNTVPGNILTDLALGDRFAFGADVFRVNAVPIFDIRSPDDPIFRALIDFAQFRDDNGTGIDADSQFVYLTASLSLDDEGAAFGNTRLYIGQYRQARQDQGGVAPTVRITSPADGAEFVEGAPLSVEIEASDDVGVAGVALFLNGMPAGSDVTAPYSLGAAVPLDVSELEVLALAVDFGGNLARSAPVVLRVIEDPAPTVQIVTPATNTELVAGAKVRVTAEATDNTSVTEVVFSVDGQAVLTDTAAPYEFDLQVPAAAAGTALTVRAAARDTIGQVRTAVAIYPIVPDPLTTAQGIVLGPDSQPIAGVTLTANGGVTGVSGPDGSFSLSGISTILGDITVVGAALVGTQPLGGSTAPVPPVPGGITQVGTLLLRPELLIADFESGTLDGFEAAGLVAVFETILDQTAPDGRFMLGMSTAFFSVATAKTNTCLNAAGLNRLAFEYNFFTRDYAPFDDTFEVVVRSSLGERRTKVTSVVQEFGPAPPPEDFRTTGFRTASIDLSGLTPGETACSLEVELRIFDVGDTLVESFVLIDRLRFE